MNTHNTVEAMQAQGGSFARALAAAWYVADEHNRALMEATWADLFSAYALIAERRAKEVA
jgi:hypothetical protein